MKVSVLKCDLCQKEISDDSPKVALPLSVSFLLKTSGVQVEGKVSFVLPPEVVDIHEECGKKLVSMALSRKVTFPDPRIREIDLVPTARRVLVIRSHGDMEEGLVLSEDENKVTLLSGGFLHPRKTLFWQKEFIGLEEVSTEACGFRARVFLPGEEKPIADGKVSAATRSAVKIRSFPKPKWYARGTHRIEIY
jgi:hypothetical protein